MDPGIGRKQDESTMSLFLYSAVSTERLLATPCLIAISYFTAPTRLFLFGCSLGLYGKEERLHTLLLLELYESKKPFFFFANYLQSTGFEEAKIPWCRFKMK